MQKIFSKSSRSANLGKQYGRGKIRRKTWRQKTKDPVGQSTSCEGYWEKKPHIVPNNSIKIFITAHLLYKYQLQQAVEDKPHHRKE